MWEDQMRKLDSAKEATIDLVTLNNTVVNMRNVVKATKVQVIHKLSRMVQKLKDKKGTEQQKKKNLRKAQRMINEIFAIKDLHVDRVSKFALGNKASFADVCKQPSASAEARSLLRLAEHHLLANKVEAFRQKHSDWEELAAYLTTKQTGRRFRTKKQKERAARKGSKFVCPLDVNEVFRQGDEEKANIDSGDGNADMNRTIDSNTMNAYDTNKEEVSDDNDSTSTHNSEMETVHIYDSANCDNVNKHTDSENDSTNVNSDNDSDRDKYCSEDEEDANSDKDNDSGSHEDNAREENDERESDSPQHSSDNEDSQDSSSHSKALSLLTKAPTSSALVEDPFFMGDPRADTNQSRHWIEKDSVERKDYSLQGRSKRGQSWRGRGQQWSRAGQSSYPQWKQDDQWLRGDMDQREPGWGRGWGHRADPQTDRGARRGSFRGGRGQVSKMTRERGGARPYAVSKMTKERGGARPYVVSKMTKERGGARPYVVSKTMTKERRGGRSLSPVMERGRGRSVSGSKMTKERGGAKSQAVSRISKERQGSGSHQEDPSSHPSWDAVRKRKQMENMATFSGKHIKFDDD